VLGFRPSCNRIQYICLRFDPRPPLLGYRTRIAPRAPRAQRVFLRAHSSLAHCLSPPCLVTAPNFVSSMHIRHQARRRSAEQPRFCMLNLPEELLRVVLELVPTEDWLTVALAYKPARDTCTLLASGNTPLFRTLASSISTCRAPLVGSSCHQREANYTAALDVDGCIIR
jgi:hypothetical protein